MILQNISRAIREQNYYAVALEFVIVIAGVVIGFQIQGWAERLDEQKRAEIMQARLARDLRAEQWRIAALIAYEADVLTEVEAALRDLDHGERLEDETLVIKAFRGTQYFWSGIIRATYDELVAGGELHLLGGGEFSDLAVEYYNSSSSNLLSESDNTPFRDAFRQTISPALHSALVASCAEDPNIAIGDFEGLENYLAFPCQIDGFEAEVASLASVLRQSDELKGLLRWRAIESEQNQSNTAYFAALLNRAVADYELRNSGE